MDLLEIGAKIGLYFIPFLFALCFHEFAHGFVAKLRGDRTAEQMGRLTMNPIAHMDMIGTLILPIMAIVFSSPIFFGWAKPVPVNERNLKNPRKDMFWIAIAGPLSNVLLAIIASLCIGLAAKYYFAAQYTQTVVDILKTFIITNLFLAFFNMIPLHPLDGGKVLARFLPASLNDKLEANQQVTSLVLMALVLTGALKILSLPVFWTYDALIKMTLGGLGL